MKKHFFSIFYMFLITLAFTALVSAVNYFNIDRIEANQRKKFNKIILKVIGIFPEKSMGSIDVDRIFLERVKSIQIEEKTIFIGHEEDGKTIIGYAVPVGGPGFWGPIEGMVGIDSQAESIIGIAFYKHSETPGLGGRIAEKWFTEQFKGLKLYPVAGDKKIFYLKPEGTGAESSDLDAITGASRTSEAIEIFLNKDLDYFLRNMWAQVKVKKE